MISPSLIIDKAKECDRLVLRNATVYDGTQTSTSLEIKAPNHCCFVSIPLPVDWCFKVLLYEDLGIDCIQNTECNPDLQDGIYEIKYKVDTFEASYYHLRVCKLWNKYLVKVCELFNNKCGNSFKSKLETLYSIRNLILDAIIMAEDCLKPVNALEMYKEAESKLDGNDYMC